MNMKIRNQAMRIVMVVTTVLLLLTALTGCFGSGSSTKLTVDKDAIQANFEADPDAHALKASELSGIADMLASVYDSDNFDTQEMLIAASRGYDMTAANFTDPKEAPDKGINLEYVQKVITAANEKASNKVVLDYSVIKEADVKALVSAFSTTVDVNSSGGFLDGILSAIGIALRWMTNTLGFKSYLVGICLFAFIVEVLMLPLAVKQQKNSIRQAKLRPKEMAIRKKYKGRNDQVTMQKMQAEIQEFYQRENFSPYSGCLPIVIQLPIIMALYSIVMNPLHYVLGQSTAISNALNTYYSAARAAGGLGGTLGGSNGTIAILADIKANGLELLNGLKEFSYFNNAEEIFNSLNTVTDQIPNFNIGLINFGLVPSFQRIDVLLLVPVLTFVTYFFTTKINRKFTYQPTTEGGPDERQVACSNNMMDITMPAMSTVFTFMVPGLIGIYWIFRSLVSLLKQFIISKVMPLPTFTEEDYKKAEREMAGKRIVKKSNNVGNVRSLHHIDDEDFDDTRERALARKAAIEERERQEQAEKAKKTPFGAAPMKDDHKKQKNNQADAAEETEENQPQSDDNQNNIQE